MNTIKIFYSTRHFSNFAILFFRRSYDSKDYDGGLHTDEHKEKSQTLTFCLMRVSEFRFSQQSLALSNFFFRRFFAPHQSSSTCCELCKVNFAQFRHGKALCTAWGRTITLIIFHCRKTLTSLHLCSTKNLREWDHQLASSASTRDDEEAAKNMRSRTLHGRVGKHRTHTGAKTASWLWQFGNCQRGAISEGAKIGGSMKNYVTITLP